MAGDTHNRVRNLIADLVWVTFTNRLGGEEEMTRSEGRSVESVVVGSHLVVGCWLCRRRRGFLLQNSGWTRAF